jgi:rubrerythrin
MTGDLISRSALLESIEGTDWYTIRYDGSVSEGAPCEEVAWYKATEIYAALENAPAVEAEPVVHAHWEKVYDELGCDRGWRCSRCKSSVYHMTYEPYGRCPHCGAHMDEEVADV